MIHHLSAPTEDNAIKHLIRENQKTSLDELFCGGYGKSYKYDIKKANHYMMAQMLLKLYYIILVVKPYCKTILPAPSV